MNVFAAMPTPATNARAFTLTELLVVLAIIGIATSIVVLSYQNDRQRKELEASAREFSALVREAQNYALTGRQSIPGTTPCRFEVRWSGASYDIMYWHRNSSNNCVQHSVVAVGTLRQGTSFTSSSSFYFTLPHAVPSFGSSGVQPIGLTKGSTRYVCVYGSGRIVDQENAC